MFHLPYGSTSTSRAVIVLVAFNLSRKRWEPLKSEELSLVLQPKVPGLFVLRPRVVYQDEDGKELTAHPEALDITVGP